MMLQQSAQPFFAGQSCGLQELAQLMHLNALIHVQEPLPCLLHRLFRRAISSGFQVGTRQRIDHKLAGECSIEWVEQPCGMPFGRQVINFGCNCHGFTIQLATSRVKRAATAVRPPVLCKATTEASASSVPSEFCTRSVSANSSGRVDAKSTSCEVPNSITVLSVKGFPSATRVRRTGMRTGLASGKNLASLAVDVSRARAAALASRATVHLTAKVDAAWVPRSAG